MNLTRLAARLWPRKIPLRPDPSYRENHLRHITPERRKRYQAMQRELGLD